MEDLFDITGKVSGQGFIIGQIDFIPSCYSPLKRVIDSVGSTAFLPGSALHCPE